MPLYLTLSRGPRADAAVPIVATSDPSVVQAVLDALLRLADEVADDANGRWPPGLQVVGRVAEAAEDPPR